MSLFGSLMGDVEDDPFFGSHMRHMHQMNNMMNSFLSDPFGMFDPRGLLAIEGPRHGGSLMPFMPQMPSMNKMFSGFDGNMAAGSSFSSRTVVMSSGPNGKPQVYSSSSSTKVGPNGIKETRKTLQDSRTGTKKMSIGHHIGDRAHVIEREQNYYSGDAEENQEFINIEEDEAEDFNREFHTRAGEVLNHRTAIAGATRRPPQLALMSAPSTATSHSDYRRRDRPSARRALRAPASPLTTGHSPSVREVYAGAQPQRYRHKHPKSSSTRHSPAEQ